MPCPNYFKETIQKDAYSTRLLFKIMYARGWACIGRLLDLWSLSHKTAYLGNLVRFVQQLRCLRYRLRSCQPWRSPVVLVMKRTIRYAQLCTRSLLWRTSWHCWRFVLIQDLHLAMRLQRRGIQRYGFPTGSRTVLRRSQGQNRLRGFAERVCETVWCVFLNYILVHAAGPGFGAIAHLVSGSWCCGWPGIAWCVYWCEATTSSLDISSMYQVNLIDWRLISFAYIYSVRHGQLYRITFCLHNASRQDHYQHKCLMSRWM